jgi:hypothetical protein
VRLSPSPLCGTRLGRLHDIAISSFAVQRRAPMVMRNIQLKLLFGDDQHQETFLLEEER